MPMDKGLIIKIVKGMLAALWLLNQSQKEMLVTFYLKK